MAGTSASSEMFGADSLRGRKAIMLGKGPSLDVWLERIGTGAAWHPYFPIFIAINESLLAAKERGLQANVCFACDQGPLARLALRADEFDGTTFILPQVQPRHIEPPAKIVQYVYGEMGTRPLETTAAIALKWCKLVGIEEVWMVGFDGYDEQVYPPVETAQGYAESILRLGVDDTALPSWKKCNLDIALALKRTGITARWYHREMNGKARA